ncbi:YcjF family protein [Litorilituus sediminis]|uniref:TIGR01620 family protein n=1 Tax=Litorilituus sediminis TaxID=718192 RepID=A0A4P6PCG8_9GAMM|nr:TIGR01620 family protein [Litorilituus sediminis]QBG37442.1 TIGR01620 family protein [Litorilituus sediminis]
MTKETSPEQQQQILFSEPSLIDESKLDEPSLKQSQQQLFDNEAYLPDSIEEIETSELQNELLQHDIEDVEQSSMPWIWRIIFVLLMSIVTIEAVDFFIEGFTTSPFLTSLYGAILAALVVVSGTALFKELVGLKQFKARQQQKQQALALSQAQSEGNVEDLCNAISSTLPCDIVFSQEQAWQQALSDAHSQQELLQLYSRLVLEKVDDKAIAEVAKFSSEAVVLVALSPVAIIDMLIILSRNLRMINKIAGLYGLKLGYWSRIKLIKQVFVNMAYAGASEIVADLGSDVLGAELLGKLSTKLAQGLGAGMLTARLGIKTMQLCRPLAFDDKPKLSHVRSQVVEQIKGLIKPAK